MPGFSASRITAFNAASFAMRGVGLTDIIVYQDSPVYEAGFCNLWAEDEIAARHIIPALFTFGNSCSTSGLVNHDGLCLLMRPSDDNPDRTGETPFELFVRDYGPHEALARHLIEQIKAWDAAGRPGTERLRIRAYPRDTDYRSAVNEIVDEKNWTRLVLDWQR